MKKRIPGLLCGIVAALALTVATADAAPIACGGSDLIQTMRADRPDHLAAMTEKAAAIPNGEGLLWRIEGDGLAPSYLFGTIHFTDLRVHDFSPAVTAALDEASAGVVESLYVLGDPLDDAPMREAGISTFLPGGQTLADLLDVDQLAALKAGLAARLLAYEAFKTQKPWVLMQVLSYPPCELASLVTGSPIVDKDIALRVKAAGKPLIGLETAAEQIGSLEAVPMDAQVKLLLMAAEQSDRIDDVHETMLTLYRSGDVAMIDLIGRDLAGDAFDAEAYRQFMDHLLVRRNRRMLERALPHMEKGGVFIAVGALHLPGEEGLVALFRKAGYTVTRVE